MGDAQSRGCGSRILLCAVILLSITTIALLIAVVLLHVRLIRLTDSEVPQCPQRSQQINTGPPTDPPPFHDLTEKEISKVTKFLYDHLDLNLVPSSKLAINASYIFTMELNIPSKSETLDFLDNGKPQPKREAIVIIFRGDKAVPDVEEYIVGPLPDPVYKRGKRTRPFIYRPLTQPEYISSLGPLTDKLHNVVGHILQESYDGGVYDCSDKCYEFQIGTPISSASTGYSKTRKMWFWLVPLSEYKTVLALDFLVLMDLTSNDADSYRIDMVYYAGQRFASLEELRDMYDNGEISKTRIKYPSAGPNLFSSPHRRGTLFPSESLLPPEEFEPSGHRYSIQGQTVEYMGWQFNFRMSTSYGPQLFDIKFNGDRIVYELSLQEIAIIYSGHSPGIRFADFADSVGTIGQRTRALVPGYDCPKHAVFLPTVYKSEAIEEAVKIPTSLCVFEHNTGVPLRRHLSFGSYERQYYEALVDYVLTLRTIVTLANYDYIFDFIFHQNGAIETKATLTGYIFGAFRFPQEDQYGFRLNDHLTGNIHQHLFHFKVDMDINGRKNRFESLDIVPVEVNISDWFPGSDTVYSQTKLERNEKTNEKNAALEYKFEEPKYLIFHNNNETTEYGAPKAYRLLVNGISKQMYKRGKGQENSYSWSRYQVAVTKHKEDESRSSSVYASWDGEDPVVNFQKFIDDNDVISDQDQVAWVTVGMHHIPHMEDLPVTPTVGLSRQFFLLPYNYFPEDPAMGSGDAIRIEPKVHMQAQKGLKVTQYKESSNAQCAPVYSSGVDDLENNPANIFDLP